MEKYIYLKTSVLESVNGKYGDIKITSNQALLRLQYDILFVDTNTTVLALFFIIVIRHEWGNILIFLMIKYVFGLFSTGSFLCSGKEIKVV